MLESGLQNLESEDIWSPSAPKYGGQGLQILGFLESGVQKLQNLGPVI